MMDAELEVQRTIKRAELTVFLCLLRGILWRDADMWILIWDEVHRIHQRHMLLAVQVFKQCTSRFDFFFL